MMMREDVGLKKWCPGVIRRAVRGGATLIGLAGLVFAGTCAGETPPNVVLLMGDDHGWEETGYSGHPHLYTPVLDEMAATGLRMDRFYSAHPTCSPTRGSVLTGRHPNRYGCFTPNHSMRPEEETIAQLLGSAGYLCGHFGKWHVGPVKASSPTSPGAMGFDRWVSHDNFFELDPVLSRNGGPPEKFPGESSKVVVDEALDFIAEAKRQGRPFLAVVWFGSPHEPYSGLPADLARYDSLPESYSDREVRLTSNETGRPTRRPQRDVLQERYAEITAMDRAIGELRARLSETGLRENTLVWYCGDNGTPQEGVLASPLRGRKGQLYEGGIRVPGVIEWPARIDHPSTSRCNAVTSDVLPTLCELAGVHPPDRPLDGISLVPLIDGNMPQRPAPIFFWTFDLRSASAVEREPYIDPLLQSGTTPLVKRMGDKRTRDFRNDKHPVIAESDYGGRRVVLDGDFKLVLGADASDPEGELFDLSEDEPESTDVSGRLPQRAVKMKRQMRRWQESVLSSLTGSDYE